jgi:hypothetical protein
MRWFVGLVLATSACGISSSGGHGNSGSSSNDDAGASPTNGGSGALVGTGGTNVHSNGRSAQDGRIMTTAGAGAPAGGNGGNAMVPAAAGGLNAASGTGGAGGTITTTSDTSGMSAGPAGRDAGGSAAGTSSLAGTNSFGGDTSNGGSPNDGGNSTTTTTVCGGPLLSSSHACHFEGVASYAQIVLPVMDASQYGGWDAGNTFELWFRTTATVAPLLYAEDDVSFGSISLNVVDGGLCFYYEKSTTPPYNEICTATRTLNDGAWHHAAAVVTASRLQLFEDGLIALDAPENPPLALPDQLGVVLLGNGQHGAQGDTYLLAGDLDEVRIWFGARAPSDIRDCRATELSAVPDPQQSGVYLLGYYRLEEADETGTEQQLTDTNADYQFIAPTPAGPSSHPGELNVYWGNSPWIAPGAF